MKKRELRILFDTQQMTFFNIFSHFLQIFIEFCDGGALDTIIVDLEKGLTEKQIAYVCRGMCQGLVHLHKQGIIHRDLKAGNVLLTCQVWISMSDFQMPSVARGISSSHQSMYTETKSQPDLKFPRSSGKLIKKSAFLHYDFFIISQFMSKFTKTQKIITKNG